MEPTLRGACVDCLRRSRLLCELGPVLDYRCGDRSRLLDLLGLDDGELIDALGGRRRDSVRARHLSPAPIAATGRSICRHDPRYPLPLREPPAPAMLHLLAPVGRLQDLVRAPIVAILGGPRGSDYGVATAGDLARGLAASGLTVIGALGSPIADAAHHGSLEAGRGSIAVLGGGLDVACPVRSRPLLSRLTREGCPTSELPAGCRGRRWGPVASLRTVLALASLVVIVESQEPPEQMWEARLAHAIGRPLAAVPGPVSSALSRGPNLLLAEGASLVTGAQDVLELLYRESPTPPIPEIRLEPALERVLARVGEGWDTPGALLGTGLAPDQVALALAELEVRGLLTRGNGGRYLPRQPPPGQAP